MQDSPLLASQIIDLIRAFEALEQALSLATNCIVERDAKLPVVFLAPPELGFLAGQSERQQVATFLNQLTYLEAQPPKSILIGPGIVASSDETLSALNKVNEAKQNFKAQVLLLKQHHQRLMKDKGCQDAFEQLLSKRDQGIAHNLHRLGLSRLHLKQTYRLIPLFEERPSKIAWTWANTRAIQRISVQEAMDLLTKQGTDPRLAWQQARLQSIPPDEPLAIVQELAPHLRANMVFGMGENSRRQMVKGPVPFFYWERNPSCPAALPPYRLPTEKKGKDKNRPTRKDVKLDPQVFLPAIRAHRYSQMSRLLNA